MSSIATLETHPYIIDLANEPIIQMFETKLAALQTSHQTTNVCLDKLDVNINLHMDTLDNSIQSLVLSSNANFGLLLEQFGSFPPTGDPSMSNKSATTTHLTTDEMEVDIKLHKHEWAKCSRTSYQQLKK